MIERPARGRGERRSKFCNRSERSLDEECHGRRGTFTDLSRECLASTHREKLMNLLIVETFVLYLLKFYHQLGRKIDY